MGLLKFIMLTQFWPQVALLCLLVYAQLHSPQYRIMTGQVCKQESKSCKKFKQQVNAEFQRGWGRSFYSGSL